MNSKIHDQFYSLNRSASLLSPGANSALRSPGQPLDAATRAFMEPAFGHDFSRVRVHSDRQAGQAASALGALAYTSGQDLVFRPGLYNPHSPSGRQLLAHELTHVVQQEGASSIQSGSSGQAGDRHEQEASRAAGQIGSGGPVAVQSAQSVPQIQLQRVPEQVNKGVPRSEVQRALEQFLTRAQSAQQSRSLRLTPAVRTLLQRLVNLPDPNYSGAGGDPQRGLRGAGLDGWLNGGILPGDPATFARQVMRFLPDPCDPQALSLLGVAPSADATPGKLERVKDLVKDSAAGEPDPSSSTKQAVEDRQPSSSERADQLMQDQLRRSGQTENRVGPFAVDILRLGRIASGLPNALRDPKPRKPQPAELSPDVLSAIGRVPENALTPPGASAGDYADAREVAATLARELESAHQAGRDQIIINLGATYNNVKDLTPIIAGIRQIAQQMRAALPHKAPGVKSISLVFGTHLGRVIPLDPAPSTAPTK